MQSAFLLAAQRLEHGSMHLSPKDVTSNGHKNTLWNCGAVTNTRGKQRSQKPIAELWSCHQYTG